jgi:KaiC/GvpD/RAD55 family RecA-like ATPase
LVLESLDQDAADPDRYLVDHLPHSLAGLMGSLLEEAQAIENENRLLEDLFRSVIAVRRRIVDENLSQLRYLIEEDRVMAEPYHRMVVEYTRTRQLLDQARLAQNGQRERNHAA